MKIRLRTNLDEPSRDVLDLNAALSSRGSSWQPPVPRRGERISFPFKKDGRSYSFELEVCAVTYDLLAEEAIVELHVPSYQSTMTIREWSDWFKKFRLGRA